MTPGEPLRLTYSREAQEDLIGIWSYIQSESPNAADRVLHDLESACQHLARVYVITR